MLHKSIRHLLLLTLLTCAAAAQGVITTVAGTDWVFPGNHKPALNAPLSNVLGGIAVDPAGNPVFVDSRNCMVARINPDGTLDVVAGNGICVSTVTSSGEGGPATRAAIYDPGSVAFDRLGNLYFSNFSQVRRIADGIISTVAGSPGLSGFSGDGGPATQARIDAYSGGIVVDASGNVFFADNNNNRIRRVTPGGIISTIAGNGTRGYSGDLGPATNASLDHPQGLALDSAGNLYIADTFDKCVRKIAGGNISTVVSGVTAFSIAFDSAGVMYLGSYNAVYKVAPGSTTPVLIAGSASGKAGYSGDNGPASGALFNGFNGTITATVDTRGNIYIADTANGRVRKIANGIITTIAGNGQFRYSGEGLPAVSATLNFAFGVALDASGNKYVAELDGNRVRKISSDGVITTFAGTGSPGLSGDNGPATKASLNLPGGLLFNGGNLYIADTANNLIRKVSPSGIITSFAGVTLPNWLAMDAAGNLYVSTGDSRVMKIDPKGTVSVFAGTGTAGSSGDGGAATSAMLNSPAGLAFDASGNLYVADYLDNRVRKITPQGTISTFAGNGTFGSTGDGGQAAQAQVGRPKSITFDAAGNLYITQTDLNRVSKVTPSGVISRFAGGGPSAQLGDGGMATAADVGPVEGIAVDGAGNVFFTDAAYDRLREVLAAPPTMQVAPTVLSMPGARSGGAPVTQTVTVTSAIAGLAFNVAIKASGSGNWLTADTSVDNTPRLLTLTADPSSLASGTYTATVTITPVAATPATLTVNVSFTVDTALSPQLAVDHTDLSFTLPQGSASRSVAVQVSNSGGQMLNYTATGRTVTGANWLAISPGSGKATPGSPSTVTVTANPAGLSPGTYTGQIAIQAGSAGSRTIPVILTVSANKQAVLLTQTGLSFTAVAGGGVIPPQYFGVINAGTGVMAWKASTSITVPGVNWLQVSPATGSSDASGAAPQVTVAVNAAGLKAGKYYGTVRIDAPGTANQLRVLTVFLNVLPAGTPVAASVQPPELVFYASSTGGPPSSQTVNVYDVSATPRTLTASLPGFFVLPRNTTLDPNVPAPVVIQPFNAVASTHVLTFQFSDGTVQIVKVRTVLAPPVKSPQISGPTAARVNPADSSCAPSQLVVSLNTLSESFQVSAGWPVGLSVNAQDDCGNPVVAGKGSVWAHFDNGEDDVPLTALGDGTWQGTWRPQKVNPNVTMTINARSGDLPPAQKIVGGAQSDANDRPTFTLSSVTNVFATPTPEVRPLAPGSFLSIYGDRLSDYTADSGGVLQQQLGNTQVFFNDVAAPIQYARADQVNVVVPIGVNLNTSAQVRVQRGDTLSEPVAVDIAASHTSVLQISGNAYATDTPASGGAAFVVGATTPAKAGDTLTLYCTGLGVTTPPVADGAISPASTLATVAGVTATIGEQNATVSFAGLVPGFVGLYQLNLAVPSGVTPGAAVPLTVTSGGQTSPAVNLAIR